MSAVSRLRERFAADPGRNLKLVGATGQLGYGIPAASLAEALRREPDMLGADMGSTDIGPAFLGNGQMATSAEQTKRDLAALLKGARSLDIPLIIGSAGSAGAGPHRSPLWCGPRRPELCFRACGGGGGAGPQIPGHQLLSHR